MAMIRTRLVLPRRAVLMVALAALVTAALLAANIRAAQAHSWGVYHWDKSGSAIYIYNYNFASNSTEAEQARQDGWNKIGILYNYGVNYHTDISVFDGAYGNTGWSGLATLEQVNWDGVCLCWSHIGHAHARYNTSMGWSSYYVRGVFCQEIAHGWGLDHSDTGDCMGMTYYNWINTYGPHNNDDFNAIYRYH
jgi:hypothetical protein